MSDVKKRLFVAYGPWTILNYAAIIKMQNDGLTNELVILCDFDNIEYNKTFAQGFKLFDSITCLDRRTCGSENFDLYRVGDYKEVYFVDLFFFKYTSEHTSDVLEYSKVCDFYILSESIWQSVYKKTEIEYDKILKGYYYTNYLNKFTSSEAFYKLRTIEINKDVIHYLLNLIRSELKLDFVEKQGKNIVISFQGFAVVIYQNKLKEHLVKVANAFRDKGFKVYIKPHPNDNNKIKNILKNIDNIEILDTNLPIEVLDLDIIAIASYFSTSLYSYPHFNSAVALNLVEPNFLLKKNYLSADVFHKIFTLISLKYSLNYKKMLGKIDKNMSGEKCKEIFTKEYEKLLKKVEPVVQDKLFFTFLKFLQKVYFFSNSARIGSFEMPVFKKQIKGITKIILEMLSGMIFIFYYLKGRI